MFSRKFDQQLCPYGAKKKCTYGNKCKFFHPERGLQPHRSVTERLSDFANYHLQARTGEINKKQIQGKSLSVPLNNNNNTNMPVCLPSGGENFHKKQILCRTTSNTPNMMHPQQQHLLHGQIHQPQQYRLSPQQTFSASTSPINNLSPLLHHQQQQFPKSHSIDNLPHEMFQPPNYNYYQQGQPSDASNQHDTNDMSINLHKKLQRQLSLLNPFDPRINSAQRYHNSVHMVQGNCNSEHFQIFSPSHKTLSTSHSLTSGIAASQNQVRPIYEHQVHTY